MSDPPRHKRVMICAGEASGDLHASNLIRATLEIDPDISFYGLGGEMMKAAGCEIVIDSSEFGIIGLSEVLSGYNRIKAALDRFKRMVEETPPSLVVFIDYPEFNTRLAGHARKCGVPVLYYISPQVWAWRKGRAKKIARIVDHMAVVFPFEVEIYEKEGLKTTFVGHPLIDAVKVEKDAAEIRRELGVGKNKKLIGLLPGSRSKEIQALLPAMLESAEIMASRSPEFEFVIPLAHTVERRMVEDMLSLYTLNAKVVEGKTHEVMKGADLLFVASGTATLETAILGTPMVVVYRTSALTYHLVKLIASAKYIALPNIVAGREIVPELIQEEANPGRMVEEAFRILFGKGVAEEMRVALGHVRESLGGGGASKRVAELIIGFLGRQALPD